VHEFAAGSLAATVEEQPPGRGERYRLVIRDADNRGGEPLLAVSGENVPHLAAVCAGAGKLIEYLSHGFPYDAWREDYDPTYRPDAPDS
jgi:hypothetical protein